MSYTSVPSRVQLRLWGKAAGLCEYEGCNDRLWLDNLTQAEFNTAYIAHIVADSPQGPRGSQQDSNRLKATLSNLMLLCDKHHRLIDREQVEEHTVARLIAMKTRHELRIELLGALTEEKQSHVLLFGANVGVQSAPVTWAKAAIAMVPDWYPADTHPIEIGLKNSLFTDRSSEYWSFETRNLEGQITQRLMPRIAAGQISHLSVFALAPQPLLVLLGSLLSDIPAAEVYQLHREPQGWRWQDCSTTPTYKVEEPTDVTGEPALVLSLSADISEERVRRVMPQASIWSVSIDKPHNDFLKCREQATMFRQVMRNVLNRIKLVHSQAVSINVFPAMPVALAVELGRVRMPKADLPLVVYDEQRNDGGFVYSLTVG